MFTNSQSRNSGYDKLMEGIYTSIRIVPEDKDKIVIPIPMIRENPFNTFRSMIEHYPIRNFHVKLPDIEILFNLEFCYMHSEMQPYKGTMLDISADSDNHTKIGFYTRPDYNTSYDVSHYILGQKFRHDIRKEKYVLGFYRRIIDVACETSIQLQSKYMRDAENGILTPELDIQYDFLFKGLEIIVGDMTLLINNYKQRAKKKKAKKMRGKVYTNSLLSGDYDGDQMSNPYSPCAELNYQKQLPAPRYSYRQYHK